MIDCQGSQFERDLILWGVRWYVASPISYRQLGPARANVLSGAKEEPKIR